jgi:amyloid beta precursor protein binding protein 1
MIGGSVAGVETLKNLVLPCVGAIFIMDQYKVTKRDIGNNFFVPSETEG